jgi:hypothetical protein
MNDAQEPKVSPLCQAVIRDGKSVEVNILEDGHGGWLLEVIDEFNNSTVWDDPFPTDQGAFDEAMKTITEEGISALIGSATDGIH